MNPRFSILTAALLAFGALGSLPMAAADPVQDMQDCATPPDTGIVLGCATAILCIVAGTPGGTIPTCSCALMGGSGPDTVSCLNSCLADSDSCATPPGGDAVCTSLETEATTAPDCLIEFVMTAISCTQDTPPCGVGADPQETLDSLCPVEAESQTFPDCFGGEPTPGPQETLDGLCPEDAESQTFPACFQEGGEPTPGPQETLDGLCPEDAESQTFPGCFGGSEPALGEILEVPNECAATGSAADDVHDVLCILTTALGSTEAFDVAYEDTDELYGSGGDDDGRKDYAVITVLGPDADKDPVLTDDGCGVYVTDEPDAGPDGEGTDCLGPALTVYLLIDLTNGEVGDQPVGDDPADGPIVTILTSGVPAAPSPLYYDGEGLDLNTVHVQDPRHGNHIYTQISDLDNDGYTDLEEFCGGEPSNPTNPMSTCDDLDGDGFDLDEEEAAGTEYDNPDTDGDGVKDGSDPLPLFADKDGDGIEDGVDNCPSAANANQLNSDGDAQGNACDKDNDNDGFDDDVETSANPPTDPFDPNSHPPAEPEPPTPDEVILGLAEEAVDTVLGTIGDPTQLRGKVQREADNLTQDVNVLAGEVVETAEDAVPSSLPDPLAIAGDPDCDFVADQSDPDCQATSTVPGDAQDPHDVDADGQTNHPNDQVDLVERMVAYVDMDEARTSSKEKNGDIKGGSGATLVVWDPQTSGRELFRLHAGNSGPGGNYPTEAFVLEQGSRNNPSRVVCAYTQGGVPFVAHNAPGSYNRLATSHPCGTPLSAVRQINDAGTLVGSVWAGFMTTAPRPFVSATDPNGDGVPESLRVNVPDPASCDPEAQTCSDYIETVVPIGGLPDLDNLCDGPGTFPTCLLGDCADDPPSCLPPSPAECADDPPSCVPPSPVECAEDPPSCADDVPDLGGLLGEVVPHCSTVNPTDPVYVCQNDNPGLLGKQIVVKDPTGSVTRI